MWKNICKVTPNSSFWRKKENKEWSSSLYWILASAGFKKFLIEHFEEEQPFSNDFPLSEWILHKYKTEAEEGISQISDPLWKRVCIDVLRVLGPVAFKDMWKINLISISPERKKAYLACPTRAIAEVTEIYHFVIIDALKKFYPSLFSLEIELSGKEINGVKELRAGISVYGHFS